MANAGHEPPLLVPGDDGPVSPIEGGGVLLGAFRSLGAPELEVQLRPGDTLVLYTDGVTDAVGPRATGSASRACSPTDRSGTTGPAHDIVDALRRCRGGLPRERPSG